MSILVGSVNPNSSDNVAPNSPTSLGAWGNLQIPPYVASALALLEVFFKEHRIPPSHGLPHINEVLAHAAQAMVSLAEAGSGQVTSLS